MQKEAQKQVIILNHVEHGPGKGGLAQEDIDEVGVFIRQDDIVSRLIQMLTVNKEATTKTGQGQPAPPLFRTAEGR